MKIQGLAVIAIIVILPMAIILGSYTSNQIKTLELQVSYDTKLINSTYDAIREFQIDMSNNTTSDLANSKMLDIRASIKSFYNSLASNFNMSGYGEEVLRNYVPAIVYTLYDGYYIYSAYNNTLDDDDTFYDEAVYKDGERIYGLKPYIYYSCRYKPNNNSDFVITYSLDSYITIQGIVDGMPFNEKGYLLTGVASKNIGGSIKYYYNDVEIVAEENDNGWLEENVYEEGEINGTRKVHISYLDASGNNQNVPVGSIEKYPCKKINGVKYYQKGSGTSAEAFAVINDVKLSQSVVTNSIRSDSQYITKNVNGIRYYKEALEFSNKIRANSTLMNLRTIDAVDEFGEKYVNNANNPFTTDKVIFDELNNSATWETRTYNNKKWIEDEYSNFNIHKTEVIKNAIESNLMVAIANYNTVSTASVNFSMPKLTDAEWEVLTKHISMITFLQGLSIGGKVYNGHSLVQNTINDDFVSEDSIYISHIDDILSPDKKTYYKSTDPKLLEFSTDLDFLNSRGILNTDLERKRANASYKDSQNTTWKKVVYYYPKEDLVAYSFNLNSNDGKYTSTLEYFKDLLKSRSGAEYTKKFNLSQIYYTALGRERFSMYRVGNLYEDIQEELKNNGY